MKQFVAADFGACGQLRMAWPASTLQVHGDQEVFCSRKLFTGLPSTHVYIQRCAQKQIFDALRSFNGPKKIIDFDDQLAPEFYLAPLRESVFNKCKSNLKYLEACAIGAVCIGSGFDDSPYSMIDERAKIYSTMNAKHIEKMFFDLCQKDTFNQIIDRQYKYINDNWLENNLAIYEHLFEMKRVTI